MTRSLLVAGALLGLVGCTCGDKTEPRRQVRRSVVDRKAKKPVTRKKPLPSLKDQMDKMQRFTEEIRRRVRANISPAGPAKVIRATLKGLPLHRYPKNFKIFYNSMLARTEAMIKSRNLGEDYDKLVDRCIACHALHAQDQMGVKQLKLPRDQWPKKPLPPPKPRPKRGTGRPE